MNEPEPISPSSKSAIILVVIVVAIALALAAYFILLNTGEENLYQGNIEQETEN